ncbi:hypothetical protein NLI96_g4808 [Meripilus lineatus]|uniref:Uncharacterized protein n=1 Tax=Meripilus lineatus TaxID=2056292 RepID=A0AAD5V5W5_9APHY|nr:hypothetical protein NLI96_g4808 [Physisporinus lineatus]
MVLQSLLRIKDDLLTKGVNEESICVWEGILKAQRELAVINPVEHLPSLLNTLHCMADANKDFGNVEESVKHAMEAVEVCLQLDTLGDIIHTVQLAEDLDKAARYLCESRGSVHDIRVLREAVDVWRRLQVAAPTVEEYIRPLTRALHRLADGLSQFGDSTGAARCRLEAAAWWRKLLIQDSNEYSAHLARTREERADWASQNQLHVMTFEWQCMAVDVWRHLTIHDADQYVGPLTVALNKLADICLRHYNPAVAIKYRVEVVDWWRNLVAQDSNKYTSHFALALEETGEWAFQNGFYTEANECRREAADLHIELKK